MIQEIIWYMRLPERNLCHLLFGSRSFRQNSKIERSIHGSRRKWRIKIVRESLFSDIHISLDSAFRETDTGRSCQPSRCCSDTESHRMRRKLNASAPEMTSATSTCTSSFQRGEIRSRPRYGTRPSRGWIVNERFYPVAAGRDHEITRTATNLSWTGLGRLIDVDEATAAFQTGFVAFLIALHTESSV